MKKEVGASVVSPVSPLLERKGSTTEARLKWQLPGASAARGSFRTRVGSERALLLLPSPAGLAS